MKQLKTGYAFNTGDLFYNFDIKKIKTSHEVLKKHYKTREKKEMAVKVFLYAIYLILLDIIENSVTFVLPTSRRAQIQMGVIADEKFKEARRNGKFQDVDFLETNFKGYQLEFSYQTKIRSKTKPIYVDSKLKNKITENANNGKRYS